MNLGVLLLLLLLVQPVSSQVPPSSPTTIVGTYSIVAWDSLTGDLGVAVQSKFLGVGAVVPYAKAGVGAIATQAFANTTYGNEALKLLGQGLDARRVVETLTAADTGANRRQLGVVDAQGRSFSFTGTSCQVYAGNIVGNGYAVQGNILAGENVLTAMARSFEATIGNLAERLLAALDAAELAGGDRRGRQSAALLVVREGGGYAGMSDRMIDIRVDDNIRPLAELRRIYTLWQSTFLNDAQMRSVEMFNKTKNFRAARAILQQVAASLNAQLRDRPDDPEVLNSVAWTLATNDIDKVRALELAKRAATLSPKDHRILDTLAECHFRLGNFDAAIAIEAELVTKEPANDEYWKQLQKFKDAKQKAGQ